jgi:hypothetical protein
MMKLSLLLIIFLGPVTKDSLAQNDSLLVGTWKGTSICQMKNSPCHDEIVVYYITKDVGADKFLINASKIVNGVAEEMGTLHFVFDKKSNKLTSNEYGIWTFNLENHKLEGTLVVHDDLYRIVKLVKDK